ncbi:hypothetical protein QL093DRAFT_2136201 [Fusarium oxysporum]|nr:hypothetical protein QL093DRAFT_2136201 [Fusarium oxysporum]
MGRVLVKWSLYSSLIIPAMAVFVYARWLLVVNHLMPKKYQKRALHFSAHEYWLSNQFNAYGKVEDGTIEYLTLCKSVPSIQAQGGTCI